MKLKDNFLLERKAMTNLDSILKSRDITFLTKVLPVKAMVFPVVMYGCESWTIKKAKCQRIDAFELWVARRSNQSILKESVLNIHWKDRCWSWSSNTLATWCEELTHWKRPWCWERLNAGGKGDNRDEMFGRHQWLDGREIEQASGDGDGQGSLVCFSPWVTKSGTQLSDCEQLWLSLSRLLSSHSSYSDYLRLYLPVLHVRKSVSAHFES